MGHAGDKDKRDGRGINRICLLFVQGPWSLRIKDLRSSGTRDSITVSPFPPRVAPTKAGMGSPRPHALTRSSSPDSISGGPLGPGGPARPWVTVTMLVTLAAAHESQLLQQCQQPASPTAQLGRTSLPNLGEQGTQILARGALAAPLTGSPGVPLGPGSPGKPFNPCRRTRRRREEKQGDGMLPCWAAPQGAPLGHPAPQGEGRRGGCPKAGLSPTPGTPPYLLWVQTSPGREGHYPAMSEAGRIEAPSQHHPHGAGSEPQTCQEGEGLTGVPGMPGCPRGPGGPVSP